jgi:hypothetical protein
VFASVAGALVTGGMFLIFDEAYPDNDDALRTMPQRFAALAQWYELTWGNKINTSAELRALCEDAGLEVTAETGFSRFPRHHRRQDAAVDGHSRSRRGL